jgi:hypothetical protein
MIKRTKATRAAWRRGASSASKASVLAAAFLACVLAGSQVEAGQEHEASEAATHDDPAAQAHHEHLNEIAVVLGGTYESEEKETFFTWGLEYERMLNRRVGVSLVGERITKVDAFVFVAPFVYRPLPALKLVAGPGWELKPRRPGGGHGDEGAAHGHESESETEQQGDENLFLWRFGVGYSFHLGKAVVTPAVNLDLVREHGRWVEAVVFDVSIGFGF